MTTLGTSHTLVTGGGGFIGSHLVNLLLSQGRRVRVLELPNRNLSRLIPRHANLEWMEGNFTNSHDIHHALHNVDAVFHLASTTLPQSSNDNPVYDIQSNLLATVGLLEQMRSMPEVPLVFISSGGTVYGEPQNTPIPETHPTNPLCSYGIVKLAIEKYLALFHHLHGINYRVLRIANPYGPGQEVNSKQGVIGSFLSRIVHGQLLEVWGDGTVIRDYVYIGDACAALLLAERYDGQEHIFNIGSGSGHSVLDIIAAIERVSDIKVKANFSAKRECDVPISVLDIRRAQQELGWQPLTTLDDGLRTTLGSMRQAID